jgi:hypothetical protein
VNSKLMSVMQQQLSAHQWEYSKINAEIERVETGRHMGQKLPRAEATKSLRCVRARARHTIKSEMGNVRVCVWRLRGFPYVCSRID